VGIDLSESALREARAYAERAGLTGISFARSSVLQTGFDDASFDLVYSTGVLHHTADPFGGLAELCRVLRPGGKILISLYNRFGAFRSETRRHIVHKLAGNDLERRVQWARRLFPSQARSDAEESYNDPETLLYDSFAVPHQSVHTVGEQLKWFERLDLEFLGSYPPLTLSDNLRLLGLDEYWSVDPELQSRLGRVLRRLGRSGGLRRRRPRLLSRLLVQLLWALRGIEVVALGGRKRT
jgi:SAM-dependent methyltransferase